MMSGTRFLLVFYSFSTRFYPFLSMSPTHNLKFS